MRTIDMKRLFQGEPDDPSRHKVELGHPRHENMLGVSSEVGSDLSQRDLDDLYDAVVCGEEAETMMKGWWEDKPHQILHRLIIRLTRAEYELRTKNS